MRLEDALVELETRIKKITDNFAENELLLDTRIMAAEKFIENQHTTNKYLKPFVVAEQTFSKVRKLQLVGSAECHQSF